MLLAVHERGAADGQVAVLLHGLEASHRTWWRVAPAVAAKGWRVLAVDLRGHGESPRAEDGFQPGDLAADLLETLAANRVTRPIDVLWGHSLGALAALETVRREPTAARRLILEDPPTGDVDRHRMAAGIRRNVALARSDPDRSNAQQRRDNPHWDDRDVVNNTASIRDVDPDGVPAAVRSWRPFDLLGLVAGAPVPALLVLGSEQRGSVLTGTARAGLTDALPRGRIVQIDAGHCVHRDRYGEYVEATLGWLHQETG